MKAKRGLFDVGFWALAVWVMVMGQGAVVIGDETDLGCSDIDVHTATTQNITTNWTKIDHPLTNDNPDSIVFATQNWNPGGMGGTYNDAEIGVFYDGAKWAIFNQYEFSEPIIPMPEGASFNFKVIPPSESVFVHTATVANTLLNYTTIFHPLLDFRPDALIFVTQNWNPGGVGGMYNNTPIGVWYDGEREEWNIFNQDIGNMPTGANFNVKVALPSESAFIHTATAGNIVSIQPHRTVIDHPLANGNPDAILLVTQNWKPEGAIGHYNNHSIGVWYNGSRWEIFNQDIATMVEGAAFNVMVFPTPDSVFLHEATGASIPSGEPHRTAIDHPMVNGDADALMFVTQNWNPDGESLGTYNDSPIGVWYDDSASGWEIFNQYIPSVGPPKDMPVGAAFNIKVAKASESIFVHVTEPSDPANHTYIDHPITNKNPSILLFVTQNWNPGGLDGTYNNSPIGVSFVEFGWSVFNEDGSNVPVEAAFNVMAVEPSESAFVHIATVDNITGFGHTTYIDHPMTNGKPGARLLVTQSRHLGVRGMVNNAQIGVWYNNSDSKWAIFNQYDPLSGGSVTEMPVGAVFNVMVLSECDMSCVPCTCQQVDFNGDGVVNYGDYVILAEAWLEHELLVDLAPPSAIVNGADLAEFIRHWLESCE